MLVDANNNTILPLRQSVKDALLNGCSMISESPGNLYISYSKNSKDVYVSHNFEEVGTWSLEEIDNAIKCFLWKYEERNG